MSATRSGMSVEIAPLLDEEATGYGEPGGGHCVQCERDVPVLDLDDQGHCSGCAVEDFGSEW